MRAASLAEFLVTVATFEHEVESVRHQLAIVPGFEPYCSFKRIDRQSKGFLTAQDLQDFLSSTGLHYEYNTLNRLIEHFSITNSGRMSLHEFTQAVLPATSPIVRDKVLGRPAFAYLAKEAELSLQGLLCKELEVLEYIGTRRERSVVNEDELFRLLSPMRLPVDARKIYDFMIEQSCQVTTEDAEAVMRRFDLDKDGVISFEEFSKVLGGDGPRHIRRALDDELLKTDTRPQDYLYRTPLPKSRDTTSTLKPSSGIYLSPSALQDTEASEALRSSSRTDFYSTPRHPKREMYELTPPKSAQSSISRPDFTEVLYQSFCELLHILSSLEKSKQALSKSPGFSPYNIFRQFDVGGKNQVSALELEDALEQLGVQFFRDEIYMLLRSYGKQHDGVVNYRDFLRMLTPRLDYSHDDPYDIPYRPLEEIGTSTDSKVCEHFRRLLEAEQLYESLRQRLNETSGYSNHAAFQKIDLDRDGFISAAELRNFVGEHESFAALFEKLDKDGDGRVSFADFVDEWTPRTLRQM